MTKRSSGAVFDFKESESGKEYRAAVAIKKGYAELEKELRKLRRSEALIESKMREVKSKGEVDRFEEQLIRKRQSIGACLRSQEGLEREIKEAWR